MGFGLNKYVRATFVRGKFRRTVSIKLDIETTIKELGPQETYRYWDVNEEDGISMSMKESI